MKQIKEDYLNVGKLGALTGMKRFMQAAKLSDLKKVKRSLSELEEYTLYKPARRNFRRRRVQVNFIHYQYCADLLDTSIYYKHVLVNKNQRMKFCLLVQDLFSKMIYLEPIKDKSNSSVLVGFKKIFARAPTCRILQTDSGQEFKGTSVQKYFKSLNIHHFSTSSFIKSAHCERSNKTARSMLARFMHKRRNSRWTDFIQQVEYTINNSKSASHGLKPISVSKKNEGEVWQRLYAKHLYQIPESQKLRIGQTVRISQNRILFTKESYGLWSKEIFKISKIHPTDPITYSLVDLNNEDLQGTYYFYDLNPAQDESNFKK